MIDLQHGDCLDLMGKLEPASIDAIITDIPYGTTQCKWDAVIPFASMWEQVWRVLKFNGSFVTTATQPFASALIASQLDKFKYDYVWQKNKGNNFVHAKNMPLMFHESVLIFSCAPIGHRVQLGNKRMTYNPQGLQPSGKLWKRPRRYASEHKLTRDSHQLERVLEFENYPTTILSFGNSDNRQRGLHPTQKPIALYEHLVRTYSCEGDTILDIAMGSGTAAIACINAGRNFIGMEIDLEIFEGARNRILHGVDRIATIP